MTHSDGQMVIVFIKSSVYLMVYLCGSSEQQAADKNKFLVAINTFIKLHCLRRLPPSLLATIFIFLCENTSQCNKVETIRLGD